MTKLYAVVMEYAALGCKSFPTDGDWQQRELELHAEGGLGTP